MSAGLGSVPAQQTYLDIGQGNRVFDSLYDRGLPPLGPSCAAWGAVLDRAGSAPAEIEPGLLARELGGRGIGVAATGPPACAFRVAPAERHGGAGEGLLTVGEASLPGVRRLRRQAGLVIAIERPPPAEDEALAIGAAGAGFHGDLTSDSTRMDGYVLSTDVAPTILDRFGIDPPAAISGEPIRATGAVDPAAVEELGDRLAAIPRRRGPVIGFALLAWLVGLALVTALSGGRLARPAVRVAGLAVIHLPLLLLLAAAAELGQGAEQLLAVFGAPLLAGVTLAALGGYRALAAASALTVLAYAVDVVAGSPLTTLSLLGPNPGLGVRFYGIGNELEALLSVLVLAGTGAALTGYRPRGSARSGAAAFLVAGLGFAILFGAGRFGADVGAAIVLPLGAAAAAAIMVRSRRGAVAVVALPLAAVALLALVDLVSGGGAHLTRSVLDAGGFDDLAQVAQRRLQLSAHSFARPIVFLFLPLIAGLAVIAVARRDRIAAWLRGRPAMRAGLAGALAATVAGTLANDSGALLLEIGSAYLLAFAGFAWAEADDAPGRYP